MKLRTTTSKRAYRACKRLPTFPSLAIAYSICMPLSAIAEDATPRLPEVVVSGTADAAGFKPSTATVGPLGDRPLLDTPYSISVITSELIENQQASSLSDLLKYLPSTQMQARGGMDVGRPQSRGMQADVVQSNHLDGLNIVGTTAYPMEQFERVEVINSLTGALYGPASPGGNFNFINKRPTDTPLRKITLGYVSKGAVSVHADLGGRIGEIGAIGYRVNLLDDDGEGYVMGSRIHRKLASAALDFHFTKDTVLEFNASHYSFEKFGYPGGFSYSSTLALPAAVDPTRPGYGQPFAGMDLETNTISTRLNHRLNDQWNITASIGRQIAERGLTSASNELLANGRIRTTVSYAVPGRFEVNSNMINLNGKIQTGGITHDLVLGTTGYDWDILQPRQAATRFTLGTASLYNPVFYPAINFQPSGGTYRSSSTTQQTVLVGDTVTFNPQWSAMLVGSFSKITARSYSASTGLATSSVKTDGFSPTASLMYKPQKNISTYIAYADSLQPGEAATSPAINVGEVLSAYRSKQWETGVKFDMGGLQGGAALFSVERPFAYTGTDNVFRTQGNQRNNGLELTLAGSVTRQLSIYSGVTFLDAKLLDTGKAATTDKRVVGAPRVQASVLAEYALLDIQGLVASGNVRYTGRRAANDTNTTYADAYTTIDAGLRYTNSLFKQTAVWRLSVNNITDKKYWASIFPGSVNGTDSAANAFLGTPRELRASVTMSF